MRLIDADQFEVIGYKVPPEYDSDSYMAGVDFIVEKIDNAPTIEPERNKGKWIDLDYTEAWLYKCDQCGRRSDFKDNFCPDCGARMDMRGEQG